MNNNSRLIKVIIFVVLVFCFVAEAQARTRTMYYFPYASYWVNYTGNRNQLKQVVFLGNVRSTTCDDSQHNFTYRNVISFQFRQHIERNYRSSLGVWHKCTEAIGYVYWDNGQTLVGSRERIAYRYRNNLVNVTNFFYSCGGGSFPITTNKCGDLTGRWRQTITPDNNTSVWVLSAKNGNSYTANEIGLGRATGTATHYGNQLKITWRTTTGWSGYYIWTLNNNCTSGNGKLVFYSGGTGTPRSSVTRLE